MLPEFLKQVQCLAGGAAVGATLTVLAGVCSVCFTQLVGGASHWSVRGVDPIRKDCSAYNTPPLRNGPP